MKEKFSCYTENGVEFAKEYCDYNFADLQDKSKLLLCYGTKNVKRDETVCLNFFSDLEKQIGCFEDNGLVSKTYCDLKMDLDK